MAIFSKFFAAAVMSPKIRQNADGEDIYEEDREEECGVDIPDNINEFESPNLSPDVRMRRNNVVDDNEGDADKLFEQMNQDIKKHAVKKQKTNSGRLSACDGRSRFGIAELELAFI